MSLLLSGQLMQALEFGVWGQEAGAYPSLDSAPDLEAGRMRTQIQKLGNMPRSHSKDTDLKLKLVDG